jgi:N utilization substance protein B
MISRRNIRVKVMQLLYAIATTENPQSTISYTKQLANNFAKTRQLLGFLVYNTVKIAQYAEVHAKQRANKNIVTQQDLEINTKLAGNTILWQILENQSYKNLINEEKKDSWDNNDLTKKLYLELVETEEHQIYISSHERDRKKETEILQFIFNQILLPNEVFTSQAEDLFNNWDDDIEMLETILQGYFTKPTSVEMKSMLSYDKQQYAQTLLETCIEKKEYLNSLIAPKFKNWDPDRIAEIDMILLQMGVAELLYFETIPTKVTINEYIDLAKAYSTPQSGQFVNGILDNLHKEFTKEGKINKVDFKRTLAK